MASKPPAPKPGEPIKMFEARSGWRYRARVDVGLKPDGSRRQESRTFPTLTEARGWVATIKTDRARGTLARSSRTTVNDLLDAWLRSASDLKRTTHDDYSHHLKIVRARWGGRVAASISRSEIEALVHELRSTGGRRGTGLGYDSVRKTHLALKLALEYGVDIEAVPKNTAVKVTVPKRQFVEHSAPPIWSAAEIDAFRLVADTDRWAAAWRMTLCGLRRGEVLGLKWDDLDLDNGTVRVQRRVTTLSGVRQDVDTPKSVAGNRTVPFEAIQPGTVGLLRAAKKEIDESYASVDVTPPDWVFTTDLGQTLRGDTYSKRFAKLRFAADVPAIHLHGVRHTIATLLHEAGATPAEAAKLLGHDVQTYFRTYLKASNDGVVSAAELLGASLRSAA